MRRPLIHGLVLAIITLCVGLATIGGARLSGKRHAFAAPVTGLSLPGVSANVPSTDENVVHLPAINHTLRVVAAVPTKQQEAVAQLAVATPTVESPQLAQAQEGAAARAASSAPPADLPLYQVYQVQEGDNVGTIAARFKVESEYIVANNAEIQDSDVLKLGESIIVPAGNGILHEVRYGETLTDIAAHYDVATTVITSFAPNHIAAADDITEQQVVFVPNAKTPVAAATVTPTPDSPTATSSPSDSADSTDVPSDTSDPPATDTPEDSGSSTTGGGGIVGGGPRSGHGLIWPVVGPISSYYGPSHPLGIDIDGYNLAGAPIAAATSGTVVFAGGNSCCSYGLYVVVVSPAGIETLYGHLSSISVSQGQSVSQGEELGIIGNTGYSTGRHLHFEVIDNGVRVDPLSYLP
jgi:murein DD-endopeptidase MepM/ murein hydrolase activator NlpD